eukprot:GHUV01037158.1.p1 GENE.GHUV01037158.1~~GHUV01037158.1.p1  ORF type:complete len:426 (+),score=116.31 GHUV01037158.1:331-1608(+)
MGMAAFGFSKTSMLPGTAAEGVQNPQLHVMKLPGLPRDLQKRATSSRRQSTCLCGPAAAKDASRSPCSNSYPSSSISGRNLQSCDILQDAACSRPNASDLHRKRRTRNFGCLAVTANSSGNGPATSISTSTNNIVPKQHQQHHHTATPLDPQQQQLQSMHQLVQQQQAAIKMLQQEVQQLQWAVETHPSQPAAKYEGTYKGMGIEDFRHLPDKIIMVRHAESQGNVDARTYSTTPDYEVPLSARGWEQAVACGNDLRKMLDAEHGKDYKLFFMTSPYCRTRQTFVGVRQAFPDENFAGVQEEVQLREQDFGNFQDPVKIKNDLAERNRFGRFYFRFPDGESGSDVYNRISIFEDHLIRDMKSGKFSHNTNICLVTHGLTMRVFLMRWFNWTVESFLQVGNIMFWCLLRMFNNRHKLARARCVACS